MDSTTNNLSSTDKHWVSMWGNAMSIAEHRPETYGKNITFRYPIYCPFDGDRIKLQFDNYCGTETIHITRCTILYGSRFTQVFFNQKEGCAIMAGQNCTSDEVEISIHRGDTIYVSFYFEDYTLLRSSVVAKGPLSSGVFAISDMTGEYDIPINLCNKTSIFYFLNNISIYTTKENHAIVCYGDSITAQNWPDELTLRAAALGKKNVSIIRRATSGSRILRQYSDITYESYGLKGTNRFMHEVPTDGADIVIIQQGINDIIHPVGTDINPFRPMSDLPTADELIDGLQWYISKARELNYQVYVGTLLPIEGWRTYAGFREDLKNAYNEWIRHTDLIDGCIDFDLALRNPDNPHAFLPIYDSGDHLHPSSEGYKKMADTIPDSIL